MIKQLYHSFKKNKINWPVRLVGLGREIFILEITSSNLVRATKEIKKGEVAEWSIAAVLKTVDLQGSGGPNPSLSAKEISGHAVNW